MNINQAFEVKIVWIGANKLVCKEYISYLEEGAMKYAKRKQNTKLLGVERLLKPASLNQSVLVNSKKSKMASPFSISNLQ